MLLRFTLAALLSTVVVAGDAAAAPWSPSHIVVVIEENHAFAQIIGNPDAPFINKLAAEGALFTDAHGIRHPSQPNYLALFSGATQGTIAPEGGCPGNFFTSRKWTFEHDALIIRDHKGQTLAQLSFTGGHFEGQDDKGGTLSLSH